MKHNETELSILESIFEAERGSARVTQRELALHSGLSLGMTNALVKRLVARGWVKLTKLSTRSVYYALTPDGLAEIAKRTASYFRRASQTANLYREKLEQHVIKAKREGVATIVLAGSSEMDFILEYLCERHGIVFVKSSDIERALALGKRPGVELIVSERGEDSIPAEVAGERLSELLVENPKR